MLTPNKVVLTILSIILIWGCFLRIYQLGHQSLWTDEGYTINAALSVQERGVPLLDSGAYYANGSLSVYAVALMMDIFGLDPNNPWPARLPAAVSGVALIVLIFCAARRWGGNIEQALMCSGIIAIMDLYVAWSRQARGYMLLSCFVVASFIFLERYVSKQRVQDLFLWGGMLVGAILSHAAAIAVLPAYLVLLAGGSQQSQNYQRRITWALAALFFVAVMVYGLVPLETSQNKIDFIIRAPLEITIFVLGSIVAYFLALYDERRRAAVGRLALFCFVSCLAVFFFSPFPQFRYFLPALPFLIMLSVYAISRVAELFSGTPRLKVLISITLFFGMLAPVAVFVPTSTYKLAKGTPQPDFKAAYMHIHETMREEDVLISTYTHLNKIYVGDRGYWLGTAIKERQGSIDRKVTNGTDFYTGTRMLRGTEELMLFIEGKQGVLMLDSVALIRMPEIAYSIRSSDRFVQIFEIQGDDELSRIIGYRF